MIPSIRFTYIPYCRFLYKSFRSNNNQVHSLPDQFFILYHVIQASQQVASPEFIKNSFDLIRGLARGTTFLREHITKKISNLKFAPSPLPPGIRNWTPLILFEKPEFPIYPSLHILLVTRAWPLKKRQVSTTGMFICRYAMICITLQHIG